MSLTGFGYTIFCDDIREEVGNKLSYMGAYQGTLFIQGSFPFVMPKFCMMLNYFEDEQSFTKKRGLVKFEINFPGDAADKPSWRTEFPIDESSVEAVLRANAEMNEPDIERIMGIRIPVLITPFVIKEAGAIKVRAYFKESAVKIGALRIALATPR